MRLDETSRELARDPGTTSVVPPEALWHVPPSLAQGSVSVQVTRWTDLGGTTTRTAMTPSDLYVVRVFLAAATIRLAVNGRSVLDGAIAPGSVHVSRPGDLLCMSLDGPVDSVQWYLPVAFVRGTAKDMDCLDLLGLSTFGGIGRDSVLEQLARALLAASASPCLPGTAAHFALPVLSRLFQLARDPACDTAEAMRVAIPRWRMQRVDAYIHEHLSDPISLATVAAVAGLSPMHFAACFRLATGQRPHHYILRARIEHAKSLLVSSERSVVQVAGDTGFRTQAHFTTIFKRLTGNTPRAWRRERSLEMS